MWIEKVKKAKGDDILGNKRDLENDPQQFETRFYEVSA